MEGERKWKEREEPLTSIQNCAPQTYLNNTTYYYYCSRAGIYQSKGSQKRQIVIQRSLISGTNFRSGCCNLLQPPPPPVHETKLGHLNIEESTRLQIAAKLQQVVAIQRIMDDLKDSIENGPPGNIL